MLRETEVKGQVSTDGRRADEGTVQSDRQLEETEACGQGQRSHHHCP